MEQANLRETELNVNLVNRESELAQMQAQLALSSQHIASRRQNYEALELAAANERAAKDQVIARYKEDIIAKKQTEEIARKHREKLERAKQELTEKFQALQLRGFTSRPDGWDKMNPEEQHKCKETIRTKAQTELKFDANTYNLAVTGATGTGKSSLINAFRLLTDNDTQSAKTGEVETTMEAQAYGFPSSRRIVLWDLPGADTAAHPAHSYFMDKKLIAFDCVMIVTAGRFTETEIRLGESCRVFQVPVIFIRNKSDQSLASMMKNKPFSPEVAALELKAKAESNIRSTLAKYNLSDAMLFVVSAWAFGNNNFQQIDEAALVEFILNCARRT